MQSSSAERATVIKGIIQSAILSVALFTSGYYFIPDNPKGLETPMQRLVFTLRWQSVSILTFLFGIVKVANKRFYTKAIDPISGKGEQLLAVDSRYLQNTFEQFVLNAFGQLVLSTYLNPGTASRVIPTLVLMFTLARILFWVGYQIAPLYRALGFSIGFQSTVAVTFCNLCFLLSYGAQF